MTDHPTDDFDELLRSAARDYNRPGDVPRERMWTEIRAARARRATVSAHPVRKYRFWLVPVAAAAVLVIGIAIGRLSNRETPVAPMPKFATADSHHAPIVIEPNSPIQPDTDRASPSAKPSTPNAPRAVPTEPRSAPQPRSHPFNGNDASMAYRLAVVEHLAGTEAMLTSFRAAAKRGEVDAQITSWAKNLLTTTRLLQASAAQEDPTMKRLLDDLELVLVQIAQYTSTGAHHAQELELIEHSIERRGVIGKLQTNIPARLSPAGT
jgi:hypothetical protein